MQKRILKDAADLGRDPLPGASAVPTNELQVWHGNIMTSLTIKGVALQCPIHFLIQLKDDYPSSAPDLGFPVHFPFRQGATMNISAAGPLKGMMAVCLNLVGNFSFVHTEWSNQVGEGWSAAMSISSLLVQLQSLLITLDMELD